MKNAFYLFVMIITVFASCKKDAVTNTPPVTPVTIIEKYVNGDEFIQFFYDEDTIVNEITIKSELSTAGEETNFSIAYNDDKTIKELNADNGQRIVPVYDNGRLTRADVFQETMRIAYTAYNYENNKLKKATVYYQDENDFLPVLEFILSYNGNGNISETILMMADETPNHLVRAGHVTMEYDAHQNPLFAHNDLLALFWQTASENNITVENHFSADLSPEDQYQYTYTYLNNGMPAGAVVKKGLPGLPPTTSNVDFIYK